MRGFSRHRTSLIPLLIGTLLVLIGGFSFATLQRTSAQAASPVIQPISRDPFTNSTSQHHSQVEPDTFSSGSTVVSAFQSGRFYAGGGSSGISWATSTNAGLTWQGGTLPGITVSAGGSYARASDPAVAYDSAHGTWIIASLAAKTTFDGVDGSTAVIVSRSTNGGASWTNLLKISQSTYSAASAFYRGGSLPSAAVEQTGKVYLAWAGCYFESKCATDDVVLRTTTDGLTWTPMQAVAPQPARSMWALPRPSMQARAGASTRPWPGQWPRLP